MDKEQQKKMREGRKHNCPMKNCNGQVTTKWSSNAEGTNYKGFHVYLPGKCRVRVRKCDTCSYEVKTVEIPLQRYVSDLTLIRKLKAALKEYIHDMS